MFDRFFKRRDNKKADKVEKRSEMTEQTQHDHNEHIHQGYIQVDETVNEGLTDHDESHDAVSDSVEDYVIAVDPVQAEGDVPVQTEKEEKPEYVTGSYAQLTDGKSSSSFRQITSGPQVAYVNRVLGLSGDQYTEETTAAVREYQKEKGFRVTGKVSPAMYRRM